MTLGKRIPKDDYNKYQYISHFDWGVPIPKNLDVEKTYYGWVVEKNRGGSKDKVPLFEVNLDRNTWDEVGYLIRRN
jgi:hypothetical protein